MMTMTALRRRMDTEATLVRPSGARLCPECSNLVTVAEKCPLCSGPTMPNPHAAEKEGYCMYCAEGPFPLDDLHLVTFEEDPYFQMEDGDINCICRDCKERKAKEAA